MDWIWEHYVGKLGNSQSSPKWKDPLPDGIPRKYWDLTYYTDKPKSWEQYNDQRFLDVFTNGRLSQFHTMSEQNEKNQYLRDLYGIKFEDVKYPYLSGVSPTTGQINGLVAGGLVQVSKNLTRLYR